MPGVRSRTLAAVRSRRRASPFLSSQRRKSGSPSRPEPSPASARRRTLSASRSKSSIAGLQNSCTQCAQRHRQRILISPQFIAWQRAHFAADLDGNANPGAGAAGPVHAKGDAADEDALLVGGGGDVGVARGLKPDPGVPSPAGTDDLQVSADMLGDARLEAAGENLPEVPAGETVPTLEEGCTIWREWPRTFTT